MRYPSLAIVFLAAISFFTTCQVQGGEFPDSWFWGGKIDRARHQQMVGKRPPALSIKNWLTTPTTLDEHKGKVILIDFWATWCGPCMKALPHNNDLLKQYGDKGLVIIAIHDGTRGHESAPGVVQNLKIEYPLGIDDGTKTATAWKVGFWPTYAAIDRKGRVRAVGMVPDRVDDIIKKLLDESSEESTSPDGTGPAAPPSSTQPETKASQTPAPDTRWLEGTESARLRLAPLERQPTPPTLDVANWRHTEPLQIETLKGKVVLLQFWGTWCPQCKVGLPALNDLHRRYADQGLVIIGVTHNRRLEDLDQIVKQHGILYPICEDPVNATSLAYRVDGYPDYFLIDRAGRLRAADVRNDMLEEAVRTLIAETAS